MAKQTMKGVIEQNGYWYVILNSKRTYAGKGDKGRQRAEALSSELGKSIEPGFGVFVAKAREGKVEEREWTYIRKDGTRVPVRLSVTPINAHRASSMEGQ